MDDKGVKTIIKFIQNDYRTVLTKQQYEQLAFLRNIDSYSVRNLRKVFCIAISVGAYPECPYCHKPIYLQGELTIDHTIPRSKGGTDAIENLQPMHGKCNFEKGCSMPDPQNTETQFAKQKRQKKRPYKRPARPECVAGHNVDDLKQKCKRIDESHGCKYSIVRQAKTR